MGQPLTEEDRRWALKKGDRVWFNSRAANQLPGWEQWYRATVTGWHAMLGEVYVHVDGESRAMGIGLFRVSPLSPHLKLMSVLDQIAEAANG